MKIAYIYRESLHNFWTTRGTEIKFSGKMWFMIILKVTKEQAFTLCSEDTFLGKPQRWGVKWTPPALTSSFRINQSKYWCCLSIATFAWYLFQLNFLLKTYFHYCNSSELCWVEKVKPGTHMQMFLHLLNW